MNKQEAVESVFDWIERQGRTRKTNPEEADYCDDMIMDAVENLMLTEDLYALPTQGRAERLHLYRWVRAEENYVAGKFDDQRDGHDESMLVDHMRNEGFWLRQIVQYYDRARIFFDAALDSSDPEEIRHLQMRGQQALAKAFMTAKGAVESSIRVFGPLPAPGVSSGNVEPWEDGE